MQAPVNARRPEKSENEGAPSIQSRILGRLVCLAFSHQPRSSLVGNRHHRHRPYNLGTLFGTVCSTSASDFFLRSARPINLRELHNHNFASGSYFAVARRRQLPETLVNLACCTAVIL